jgi:hypothetical protein
MHWAAQLYYVRQVEECMGGLVSGEAALVHYPRTVLFESAVRWTPALGDGSCRFLDTFKRWLPWEIFDNAKWI